MRTSPSDPIKYLPGEIKDEDILDAGGLDVGKDTKFDRCYLYKNEELVIAPTSTVTFTVKIRDKWNINQPRVTNLLSEADAVMSVVKTKGGAFHSVETMLSSVIAELKKIEGEKGPEVLGGEYVAFYRNQSDRLDILDQKINRIKSALKPSEKTSKLGFAAKAPSMKTTWMIIYVILGFLALMSLLFFFRWFAKTKAEKVTDTTSSGG